MANTKQIRTKIKSVKNLQKIIKALEIVSTVKLQKLKGVISSYRAFMESFLEVLKEVRKEVNIFDFDEKTWNPNGRRLLIVVTSDRGLCWAINSRIFKRMEKNYGNVKDNVDIFVVGKRGLEYFVRNGRNVVGSAMISDKVFLREVKPISVFIRQALEEKKYAKIKIYFNFFKNTMIQMSTRFKLYPLDEESFETFLQNTGLEVDLLESIEKKYLMVEPDIETFKFDFLQVLIRNIIYSAVLNNKTSEHAARMLAMKNAKDKSLAVLNQLNLLYNKTRQAKITQEISEIVSAKVAIE